MTEYNDFITTHAAELQKLLPPHLWPPVPCKVEQFGPLTKYTLGEDQPGIWAMLHRVTAADDGPPHDHPCAFHCYRIAGRYREYIYHNNEVIEAVRVPGQDYLIAAETIHRIVEVPDGEAWSLCFAGPVVQQHRHYPELAAHPAA